VNAARTARRPDVEAEGVNSALLRAGTQFRRPLASCGPGEVAMLQPLVSSPLLKHNRHRQRDPVSFCAQVDECTFTPAVVSHP